MSQLFEPQQVIVISLPPSHTDFPSRCHKFKRT